MSDRQPGFWDDVERVFSLAVDASAVERARLLDLECAGRARLRAEVESLLAVTAAPRASWAIPRSRAMRRRG
jgi:hypothetical protein